MEPADQRNRVRSTIVAGLLAGLGVIAVDDKAQACSPVKTHPYKVDASVVDSVPPGAVTASMVVDLAALRESDTSTCRDISFATLVVSASDDQTPSEELGYQVTLLCGDLPPVEAGPVQGWDGNLHYSWSPSLETGFHSMVGVQAVDLAGNVGPMTELVISAGEAKTCSTSEPEASAEGSCSMSGHAGGSLCFLAFYMLAGLGVARRRRTNSA